MSTDAREALAAASPGAGAAVRPAPGAPPAARSRPFLAPRPSVPRSPGAVRRALAPIEFTFDLRQTPPEKVVGRVFAALDRVAPDVVLAVILRDVPEMATVTANIVALLSQSGYQSDMSRLPGGGQRMRIRSRNRPRAGAGEPSAIEEPAPAADGDAEREPDEVPAPEAPSDA